MAQSKLSCPSPTFSLDFKTKINHILKFAILFLLFFLFNYSTPVAAAPSFYYVDNSVSSNGNGTQGSPWKNLSDINWTVIASAPKPCTVYISGGAISQTYNETLKVGASGSSSTWPYNGTPTGELIIKRPSNTEWAGHSGVVYIRTPRGFAVDLSGTSNIIIDGFDISSSGVNPGDGYGVRAYPATSYCVIRNCTITNCAGMGIALTRSNYVTIQNNILGPQSATAGDDDIAPNGSHLVVENNILTAQLSSGGAHADCIHMGTGGDEYIFRYNIFRVINTAYCVYVETDQCNPSIGGTGLPITNVMIYGNLFEKSGDAGVGNAYEAICLRDDWSGNPPNNYSTVYVYNNTFVNNGCCDPVGASIFEDASCTSPNQHLFVENNVFYNGRVWNVGVRGTTQFKLDYNVYYATSDAVSQVIINMGGKDYTSLSAFKAAYPGFEIHGSQGNPNLAEVSATIDPYHDLRPTADSTLLLGKGDPTLGSAYSNGLGMSTTISSWPLNVAIVPRGSAWDIGAYQYNYSSQRPNPPSNLRTN